MKPGKCCALHVGVKAPGTANNTHFLCCPKTLPKSIFSFISHTGPSFFATRSTITPVGTLLPALNDINDNDNDDHNDDDNDHDDDDDLMIKRDHRFS